jgi:hypothetical protein
MNQAFIREPEDQDPRCPQCGSRGNSVSRETLAGHLPAPLVDGFTGDTFYCPNASCEVAYYDIAGRTAAREQMTRTAYPKDPSAPICSCFGVTPEQVELEAREHRTALLADLLAKAESPEADCVRQAPDGRCCIALVQRHFRAHLPERDGARK